MGQPHGPASTYGAAGTQARLRVVRLASAWFSKSKSHGVRLGFRRPAQPNICCLAAAIDGFATLHTYAMALDSERETAGAGGHQRNYTARPRRHVGRSVRVRRVIYYGGAGPLLEVITGIVRGAVLAREGQRCPTTRHSRTVTVVCGRSFRLPFATPSWVVTHNGLSLPHRLRLTWR
jgi:hypothetical protein